MKGQPDEAFRKPKDAKYVVVHGQEEAFRPGTEPHGPVDNGGGDNPVGPQPYTSVWKGGDVTGAANAAGAVKPPAAPPPPKPPAKKKPADDLNKTEYWPLKSLPVFEIEAGAAISADAAF